MNIACRQIDRAIELAINNGNKIFHKPSGRDELNKLVVWMESCLDKISKEKLDKLNLRYWEHKDSPHNAGASGYTCDKCNVTVAFPCSK